MLAGRFPSPLYEFGQFRLDPDAGRLLIDGKAVPLEPKVFQTLQYLVRNRGRLVEKDELLGEIWPDKLVEETNLARNISVLRKTLGEEEGQQYIETVPRRGYRFVATVIQIEDRTTEVSYSGTDRHKQNRAVLEQNGVARPEPAPVDLTEPGPELRSPRRTGLLIAAALVLVAAVTSSFYLSHRKHAGGGAVKVGSIAILPFKTATGEGLNDYIGLGLADALSTKLGNLRGLVVRPTSAVQKVVSGQEPAAAAGRELGVDAVLDGRIEANGSRVRVTTELIDVRDDRILWSGMLDEDSSTVWRFEDSIGDQLARALGTGWNNEWTNRPTRRHSAKPEAYESYLKGRSLWNRRTPADFSAAIGYFQQALAIDPNYALAYAGLADCYSFLGEADKARTAANSALELDDSLAEAHASLGNILLFADRKLAAGGRELARACDLNPNYATAHHWYAFYLVMSGKKEEGVAEMRRALEIDPRSLILNTDLGQMLCFTHDYQGAISQLQKTVQMDPDFVMAHFRLGEAYFLSGLIDQGLAEYRNGAAVLQGPLDRIQLARAYALSGKKLEAIREMRSYLSVPERFLNNGWSYFIAATYVVLGDLDEAFKWLKMSYDHRLSSDICLIGADPAFDPIRSDPRYKELMEKLGLPA